MPIYGYRCEECGHELEVFQSMSDSPLKVCPRCGGVLRKLLYPVGVQFKGSGFYTTDYRNGRSAGKAETGADGSSEKTGEKSGQKSSEKSADRSAENRSAEKKAEPSATKDKD
jgi:putative FmdB family regulatory protein